MTTTELLVVFAVAMLAISVVAIAIDWVGKPIRRRFVARMYRFPEEMPSAQQMAPPDPSLTGWSDQYFVIPEQRHDTSEHVLEWPDLTEWDDDEPGVLEPIAAPHSAESVRPLPAEHPPAEVTAAPGETAEETAPQEPEHAGTDAPPSRSTGWKRGDYIYNFVGNGSEPSSDIVRTRFWKNIGASEHVAIFGQENEERMMKGRPPRRRNPRTGAEETMALPVVSYEESDGRAPHPQWPDSASDPFAEP